MADGDLPPRRDRAPWSLALALAFLALACGPKNPYRPGADPGIDAADPGPDPGPAVLDGAPPSDAAAPADVRAPDAPPPVVADARPPSPPPDAAPPADAAAPPADGPAVPVVAVAPGSVPARGRVMASWGGIAQPSDADWIGLYVPGSPHMPSITWVYTSSCGMAKGATPRPAGTCALPAPSAAGTFELRLFSTEGYILLARSAPFTVTAAP
jgi:hypothetical protein